MFPNMTAGVDTPIFTVILRVDPFKHSISDSVQLSEAGVWRQVATVMKPGYTLSKME
jgi:hypothetical protein